MLDSQRWSLRRRLTLLLSSIILLLWSSSAILIYHLAQKESGALFDASISETANLLLFLSQPEIDKLSSEDLSTKHDIEHQSIQLTDKYLAFQLWDKNNQLRYRSDNAPTVPLAPLDKPGFSWQKRDNQTSVRVYNRISKDGKVRILISDSILHRQEISNTFVRYLFLFSLIILPVAFISVRLIIERTLKSVKGAAKQVGKIEPDRLNQIKSDYLPEEIKPLVDSLNNALKRINKSRLREKQFTGDAAHELRTPLAIVDTNVQLLQRLKDKPTEEEMDILNDIQTAIERSTRLITQLLALSRSESNQIQANDLELVHVVSILKEAIELEHVFAEKSEIEMSLHVSHAVEDAQAMAVPTMLTLLVRNLIHNAVAYNQKGGRVEIVIQDVNDGEIEIRVADNGRGISKENRQKVFDRFFREQGHLVSGSGLGLSICQEIAHIHGTELKVDDGLDGKGSTFHFKLKRC